MKTIAEIAAAVDALAPEEKLQLLKLLNVAPEERRNLRGERENLPRPLPTFKGDGLQPEVDIDDSRSLRRLIDTHGKVSQLP